MALTFILLNQLAFTRARLYIRHFVEPPGQRNGLPWGFRKPELL